MLGPPGGRAGGREGACDAERAVRDVMGASGAGPDCPAQDRRRARRLARAGVAAAQFEHRAPALPVETGRTWSRARRAAAAAGESPRWACTACRATAMPARPKYSEQFSS